MFKIIISIFFIYFFIPLISLAQGYQPLVSDGPLNNAAKSANLSEFLITIYNFGVGIAVALSVLFIIFGGIQYMTTDAMFKKEEGRKRITAAVAGLLIALSSWIILNQINPKIFQNDLTLKPIQGGGGSNIPLPDGGTPGGVDNTDPFNENTNDASGESPEVIGDESKIRNDLASQGVTINKNPCTYPGQRNCTNVTGFRQSTIDAISTINRGIGGTGFVITGGTESGHAQGTYSHGNGYKFDIGQGSNSGNWSKIDSYFKSLIGTQNITPNKTYSVTVPSSGKRLDVRWENDHWDIKALP